jgi:hypothetical protein
MEMALREEELPKRLPPKISVDCPLTLLLATVATAHAIHTYQQFQQRARPAVIMPKSSPYGVVHEEWPSGRPDMESLEVLFSICLCGWAASRDCQPRKCSQVLANKLS